MDRTLRFSLFGMVAMLVSAAYAPHWVVGGEIEDQGCSLQITSCPATSITVTAESLLSELNPCGYEVPDLRGSVELDLCNTFLEGCIEQTPEPGTVVGIGETQITIFAYACETEGVPDICSNDDACSLIEGSCLTTLTVEAPTPAITCGDKFDPISIETSCLVTVPDITAQVSVDVCPGVTYTVVQSPPAGITIFPQFPTSLQITVSLEEFPDVTCDAFIPVLPVTECPTSDTLIAEGPDSCRAELPNYCDAYLPDCLVQSATEARGDVGYLEFVCAQSPQPGTFVDIGTTDVTLTISQCFFDDFPESQRGLGQECEVVEDYTCTFPVTVEPPPAELICEDFIVTLDPVVLGDDCLFTVPDVTGEVEVSACPEAEYTVEQFPEAGSEIEVSSTSLIIEVYLAGQQVRPCLIEIPFNPVQSCPASPQDIEYDETCAATIPDLTPQLEILDCCEDLVVQGAEQRGLSYGGVFCGEIRVTQTPAAGDALTEPTEVTLTIERCLVFDDVLSVERGPKGDESCELLDTCVVLLNPVDRTPPSFTCPDDLAINADENCMGVVPDVTPLVDASDNCTAPADLIITQEPVAGTVIELGSTMFSVTVTDAAGNAETCMLMVELLENGCMDDDPGAGQPTPDEDDGGGDGVTGCDPDNVSLNLLFSLLFHSPVCGATCPLMLSLTFMGITALRLRNRRVRR